MILNTRPQHQSEKLTQLFKAMGEDVFSLPLFEINPVFFNAEIPTVDYCIFLSANAAHHFFSQREITSNGTSIIAIGSATAAALKKRGIADVLCPAEFSSEGLLSMPELSSTKDKKIMIVSGENSKSLLSDTLQQRGAIVFSIVCYRREPILYDITALFPTLAASNITHIVSTSGESLQALLTLLETHHDWLIVKTLCVISDTMKNTAVKAGFISVIQAENATDEAITKAIEEVI